MVNKQILGFAIHAMLFALLNVVTVCTSEAELPDLQDRLANATADFDGVVGVCIRDARGCTCLKGDEAFPMQSVMKVFLALALLREVDEGRRSLSEVVTVRPEDLSMYKQSLANRVRPGGCSVTLLELLRLAVAESDNSAADVLRTTVGGASKVQAVIRSTGIIGARFDRSERELQSDFLGLTWQPQYVEEKKLDAAIAGIPAEQRAIALSRYLDDPRDTATPRAMSNLLYALGEGKLLSTQSTTLLLEIMRGTLTGADRLKAGLPNAWKLAHKTGTSGIWNGVTAAFNDVGLLSSLDGRNIAISVFISRSRESAASSAFLMAKLARIAAQEKPDQ